MTPEEIEEEARRADEWVAWASFGTMAAINHELETHDKIAAAEEVAAAIIKTGRRNDKPRDL